MYNPGMATQIEAPHVPGRILAGVSIFVTLIAGGTAGYMLIERWSFIEKAGDRWWPITGSVYYLRATKKVLGMRVLTPAWQRRERRTKALAPASGARESLTTH